MNTPQAPSQLTRRLTLSGTLAILATAATPVAHAKAGSNPLLTQEEVKFLRSFNDALEQLETFDTPKLKSIVKKYRDNQISTPCYTTSPQAFPIVAAASIWACVLNTIHIFQNGTDENRILGQMAEVILGCVGFPAGGHLLAHVTRFLWNHRTQVAAMLSVAGLTTAQLAPLRNARRP